MLRFAMWLSLVNPPPPPPPPASGNGGDEGAGDAVRESRLPVRVLLILTGSLALALGVLGIALPLLPTTPFVLLAGWCYARAWRGGHERLRESKLFGPMLRSGREGRYLPLRAKIAALVVVVATFTATIVWAARDPWLRIVWAAIGLCVAAYLLRLPTAPRPSAESPPGP